MEAAHDHGHRPERFDPIAPEEAHGKAPENRRDPRGLALVWLRSKRNRNTREAYRRDLNQFLAWCADAALEPLEVTRADLEAFREYLEDELLLAQSSVARKLAAVSSYYERARQEALVEETPARDLERPRIGSDAQNLGLGRDDARKVVEAAHRMGPEPEALVRLLLYNGLRVSEACAAEVVDITQEAEHDLLRITGKGERREAVPLHAATLAALRRVIGRRTEGPIFIFRPRGGSPPRPLDRFNAHLLVREVGREARLARKLRPHDLRHTFVTQALAAGKPLRRVQEDARHKDPKTTQRYDAAQQSYAEHSTHALYDWIEDDDEPEPRVR